MLFAFFFNFLQIQKSSNLISSSAAFGENPRYCYSLSVVVVVRRPRRAKTVTFRNVSVITEDIYLELGVCVHHPKSNPCYKGRQFQMHFSELCPLFDLDILASIKHPTAERWHPYVVLMFSLLSANVYLMNTKFLGMNRRDTSALTPLSMDDRSEFYWHVGYWVYITKIIIGIA